MKIFSGPQLYEADKTTVEKQDITSTELMERAGKQAFNWISTQFKTVGEIHIFCGTGNNGGDGLVLGRYLMQNNYSAAVYIIGFSEYYSDDFSANLARLKTLGYTPKILTRAVDFPEIIKEDLIVDAIFGIGLNRPPAPWVASLIVQINMAMVTVIAIDIPSGLYMNDTPRITHAIIKATYTITFQAPKLVFFLPQTGTYVGKWEVLDIGLDTTYIKETVAEAILIDKAVVLKSYCFRERFSHKGDYGHGLIIGGSYGKIGAVVLAAKACITSGTGLVTAYIPTCGYTVLQTALPEIMVHTDKGSTHISDIQFECSPHVIGVGIGLGTDHKTQHAFIKFVKQNKIPLVIDADGLNILSMHKDIMQYLPPKTIITPHPKELERLLGGWSSDFDKLDKIKAFSKKHNLIVVLKGGHTTVTDGDNLYINNTGNPGMATAGSGDVLTGIITACIAQGYTPLHAALRGVYIHGRSGDLAAKVLGHEAVTAGSIIKYIGNAFLELSDALKKQKEISDQR